MELTKKNYFQTFTILGFALCVFAGAQYPGALLYMRVSDWLSAQDSGIFRGIYGLFTSPLTDALVQYVFTLGIASFLCWLVARWVPEMNFKEQRMDGGDFLTLLVSAIGAGYVFNLLGNLINLLISMLNGKTLMDVNPAIEMMTDLTPAMMLYACVLGPFMEEVIFRGVLLKRARWFGDRTAVVFTAVTFGLMHGNISQFLYATAIGLLFGYAAVRTNGIRYSVMMHMFINSYSTALVVGEQDLLGLGIPGIRDVLVVLYSLGTLAAVFLFMAGALFFLVKNGRRWWRDLTFRNGFPTPHKRLVYLNPGFLLFMLMSVAEMILLFIM